MDYKKEYENAFAIAKDWYNDPKTTEKEKCLLEAQYPELKESEDERIRKELIADVKEQIDCIPAQDCRDKEDEKTLKQLNKRLAWLEKQGSQNLANSAQTCKDEQQSTDKVEPKFKVGDWLIGNNIVVKPCCITQIHEPYYYLTNENSFIKFGEEDKYHLWTIQDAKDGDVLYSNQIIILFKQWEDNADCNFVIAHAGIDISGKLQITDCHWLISNESKPATKEQRDLLFQKMREAGYEWDAEKKELKKIEQNHAWSEEDWDYYAAIIAKLEVTQDDALLTDSQMEFLKSLKNRVLPQPKQEWKPSDEQMEVLNWFKPLWNEPKTKAVLESLIEDLKKLRGV